MDDDFDYAIEYDYAGEDEFRGYEYEEFAGQEDYEPSPYDGTYSED